MNFIDGILQPSVICVPAAKPGQQPTPIFRWQAGDEWIEGDELPPAIAAQQSGQERNRCEDHRYRRMGSRRAA